MPNWCENKVTVTGSDEQLTAFKEYVSGKDHYDIDSHLSFHQIIPMPNEIRNTRSPVKIYDTQEETDEANKEMDEMEKYRDADRLEEAINVSNDPNNHEYE